MRDGDRHQDKQRRAALAEQLHAGPAEEAQRRQHDDDDHRENRDGAPYRAQQDQGKEQHRPQRGGREDRHLVVDRVAHGAVEGDFAGDVVVDGRVLLPRLRGGAIEKVGNLQPAQLPRFRLLGKRDADHQPGDAAVPGNEASGHLLGGERDLPDPLQVPVAQGSGIVDQRLDDEFVLEAFAVRIVGDRIDAGDIGRTPEPVGQLLDGDQGFPREYGAVLRRHRDKRGVGEGVGVFQAVERDNVRVVLAEVIADVDIHFDDAPGARGEDRHDKQRQQDGQPAAAHYERHKGVQIHIDMPRGGGFGL